jgi:hypothetical protein
MPEEKEILIYAVNIAFDVLNRAVKNKNASLANASLDAINETIRFINKAKHEEVKN